LDWQFIYKGSIRDFYPPVSSLPESPGNFQVYAESLGDLSPADQEILINKIGKKVSVDELSSIIDFAFLCLHGPYGEDGRIQGVFEFAGIPYSGSGVLSSAIGINKAVQKKLMKNSGFDGPDYITLKKNEWNTANRKTIYSAIEKNIGYPCVIKPSHQGSSIGVSVIGNENEAKKAIDQA